MIVDEENRLSAIGAFLRRTRLDELPQLFNIIFGRMSLIGPRPLLPADMPQDASLRHLVPPGLTGWAQVHGGNLVTKEEKNALDEWYIEHASLRLDITILIRTVRIVLFGEVRDDQAIVDAMRSRNRKLANGGLNKDLPVPGNVTILPQRASGGSARREAKDS